MKAAHRPRRQGVRRAVVLMPNGLTLFNLFCGIYAIVLAIRGEFASAPGFIVLGGIADTLDGRVARATGTGSRFGEELDSLVDAISFGFAPAMLVYLEIPDRGAWGWLLVFIFTSCAVMRLARFNVEQAGRKKTHFHGLPSPAAGLTLATYYWFSQTPLYNQTIILFTDSKTLADLPWHTMLRGLMAMLAALMISDVPYPAVPSIGFDSVKKVIGTLVVTACVVLLLVRREEFIFPGLLIYVLYGAVKWVIIGFIGRVSTPDEIFWDDDGNGNGNGDAIDDEPPPLPPRREGRHTGEHRVPRVAEAAAVDDGAPIVRRKRRRRGHRSNRPPGSSPSSPPGPQLPETPTGSTE
ncbi:MAG TPA: CDP-diacylglycerol--serine O-phosphatidyltransferase [Gemmatimonadaceae bacterium]